MVGISIMEAKRWKDSEVLDSEGDKMKRAKQFFFSLESQ